MQNLARFAVTLLLCLLVSGEANAQNRPTLEGLTDALCAKADRDGDTHRPEVCEARCDCLAGQDLSVLTSCSQTSPGDIRASEGGGLGVCDSAPRCIGSNHCPESSFAACEGLGSCGAPEVCNPLGPGFCALLCGQDSDCSGTTSVCSLSSEASCTTAADCSPGEYCTGIGEGFCYRTCAQDIDCLLGLAIEIRDVDSADPAAAATCRVNQSESAISSKDALECIAQIEAQTGPCAP